MSGFSLDWLDLREAADQRARDKKLLVDAIRFIDAGPKDGDASGASRIIMDLGTGSGSTLRAFSSAMEDQTCPHAWRLIDNDVELLAAARLRVPQGVNVETYLLDLNRIPDLPMEGVNLVTSSALFDLVSERFVQELVVTLTEKSKGKPPAFYSALNYDGNTDWTPTHPLDREVLEAFNRDQQTDKGFGPALGPRAAQVMEQKFIKAGFAVVCALSPWLLDGSKAELVRELINGIGNAVKKDPSLETHDLRNWIEFRMAHADSGTCSVGHLDLLALPRSGL
jgi:hypothetical protein